MGEQSGNLLTRLVEKAGEQGFSFIVMGVVCWGMYSMIIQNNKDIRDDMQEIREELNDCRGYNKQLIQELLNTKNRDK